jgi:hypothetical protein
VELEKALVSYWFKKGSRAQIKQAMLNASPNTTAPASASFPEGNRALRRRDDIQARHLTGREGKNDSLDRQRIPAHVLISNPQSFIRPRLHNAQFEVSSPRSQKCSQKVTCWHFLTIVGQNYTTKAAMFEFLP